MRLLDRVVAPHPVWSLWLISSLAGCGATGGDSQPTSSAGQTDESASAASGGPAAASTNGDLDTYGDADADAPKPTDAGTEGGATEAGTTPDGATPDPDASMPLARCEATDTPAGTLHATGCFTADGQASDRLVAYELNAPLWSDGAEKRRWIALPDGAQLEVGDYGDLFFPEGTVLSKEFALGEQRLETRLLMKLPAEQWLGVSYAWDPDGSVARLLDDSTALDHASQPWRVPARAECFECHTEVAGVSLGLTLGQLDREALDPVTGRVVDQLETWRARGWLAELPTEWPAMADLKDSSAPVSQRARAYLASNCSGCHRSGGPGLGLVDFSIELPLADMGICDAPALSGDLDVEGAKLLVPGSPEQSMVWLRPRSDAPWRMPPLGTQLVDEAGSALLAEWIRSIEACP